MRSILYFILALSLLGCQNTANRQQDAESETTEQVANPKGYYGEKITAAGAVSGPELLEQMQESDSLYTKVKAKIVASCQNTGCWMDLDLGNGEVMKVTFKDYGFFIPLESKGKTAVAEGIAKKEIIPVEMLKHYAEDEGKSQEEIDAITEPEMSYTLVASGVLIEEDVE